jgi:hypothetical protein
VREHRGKVQAHGGCDAHLDHAADHHADAAGDGELSRLQCGGGAAELGQADVDDGGGALAHDGRGIGDAADGLVGGDVDGEPPRDGRFVRRRKARAAAYACWRR